MQVKLGTVMHDRIHKASSRPKVGKWTKEGCRAWTGQVDPMEREGDVWELVGNKSSKVRGCHRGGLRYL